jgi:hypothetical protein
MPQNDGTSALDLSTIALKHAASLFFVSTVSTSSIKLRSSATVGARNGMKTFRSNRFACYFTYVCGSTENFSGTYIDALLQRSRSGEPDHLRPCTFCC